jgi:UDP-N-acetylmuramoyl-L-alanyl-D-glutamate--2,6-diaminopimelate ligase
MEVSSHALVQTRVDAVAFDVAVFTNLTRDHLDYHGTMEGYGAAKARLFQRAGLRAAVVNLDDAFGATLPGKLADGVQLVGVSALGAAQAAVQARDVVLDAAGIGFTLAIGEAVHPVRSPLLGRFNVDNLLAVAGVLHATDVAPARIAQVLAQLQPIHGRMNRLGGVDGQPLVVIDYAHTPDALQQALTSLRGHLEGRLICVFGCGGDRDRGKRPQMARIAQEHADAVIVTDDNPRSEDGDAIVADIIAGFDPQGATFEVQRDRARAIAQAVGQAQAGDIVLIAGKGHEPYQEIHGVRHPFDDTVQARAALEGRMALDQDLEARR